MSLLEVIYYMPRKREKNVEEILLEAVQEVGRGNVDSSDKNGQSPKSSDKTWSVVKKSKASFLTKKVNKWGHKDLSDYACDRFTNLTGRRLDHGPGYGPLRMREVVKHLSLTKNKPQSIEDAKLYIDFYFESEKDRIISMADKFSLQYLINRRVMIEYLGQDQSAGVVPEPDPEVQAARLRLADFEKLAKSGTQSVLMEYGVVLAVAWASRDGIPMETAVANIQAISVRLSRRSLEYWKSIASATNKYGPYPSWMWNDTENWSASVSAEIGHQLAPIQAVSHPSTKRYGFLKATKE